LLHLAVHLCALFPLAWLVWDFIENNLTADPIRAATLRTGKAAIVLLVLTLAVTPFYTVFGYKPILTIRRTLGLYTFLYVSIHFLIFTGIDYGFNAGFLQEALLEKRYALAGFSAGLILLALAITSTRGWMKRLGRKWKQLHRLIYLASGLAVVHFIWLVKGEKTQALWYGVVVLVLLLARLPAIRSRLAGLRRHLGTRSLKVTNR
jgi:sulfoxide reductase heme-binding subunit YedZ